jgi:hypothetical protein
MHETIETSLFPPALAAWVNRQKRRARRRIPIHNLIFGLDNWRYLFYRTRILFSFTLLRMGIHVAEFTLVAHTLPSALYSLILFRLISLATEGSWWGALDAMRHRIRALRHQQNILEAQKELSGWLSLSIVVGGMFSIGYALAALLSDIFFHHHAASLLIFVMGIQTALRLVSRTFYSGAYAIQRIFLPIQWLMLFEIFILLAGLLLREHLGEYTIPVCILCSSLVTAAFSYLYIKKITDFLRITPQRIFSRIRLRHVLRQHSAASLIMPAMAMLGMRLHDALLIIVLHSITYRESSAHMLLFAVYLVMPLMRSNMNWSQILYFDLSKYHLDHFAGFRKTIEMRGVMFSALISFVFIGLSIITIAVFAASALPVMLQALVPYMLITSTYGFVLVSLFSRKLYGHVILLCGLHYAVLLGSVVINPFAISLSSGLIFSVITPLLLGLLALQSAWHPPQEQSASYAGWERFLLSVTGPISIVRVQLHAHMARKNYHPILKAMLLYLPRDACLTSRGNTILIAMRPEMYDAETILSCGQGFISSLCQLSAESGVAAHSAALSQKLLPENSPLSDDSTERLIALFRHYFPTGIIQYPMKKEAAIEAASTNELRRAWLQDLNKPNGSKSSRGWFITALFHSTTISAIFLVPRKDTSSETHALWKAALDSFSATQ